METDDFMQVAKQGVRTHDHHGDFAGRTQQESGSQVAYSLVPTLPHCGQLQGIDVGEGDIVAQHRAEDNARERLSPFTHCSFWPLQLSFDHMQLLVDLNNYNILKSVNRTPIRQSDCC